MQFSADGRFLVFNTGGFNQTNQIKLYDFQTATTALISKSFSSPAAGNGNSDSASISVDGRFIAYRSVASDIVLNDTNGVPDIFHFDQLSAATTLVDANASENFAGGNRSLTPIFTGDSQTLLFQSAASDLVERDFNQASDLFAFSLTTTNFPPAFVVEIFSPSLLSWPGLQGKSYQAQFKNDFNEPSWQVVNGNVGLIGNRGYVSDFTPAAQRFYRVISY